MRIQKKSSRALKRAMATVLSFALAMSAVAVAPTADAASKKKPKLSAKKKTLYYNGKKTFTLKVKKGKKVKKIKKTTWKTSNKKVVKISKKKKTSVKLTAKKKGSAKITATVKYTVKGSKKVKKVKLTCKVTSKKKSSGSSTTTNAPASKAPTTTAPAGGGQSGTQSKAPAASQPAASVAPSTKPEESAAPSTNPEESVAPSTKPEESVAPSTKPEESVAPSTKPEESAAPSTNPEESVAPSTKPEESVAPSTNPEESVAPSTKPEESAAPSTKPEESVAPSTGPAASVAPSTGPAASVAPSTGPAVSANPASGSATVVITGSAVSGSAIQMKPGDSTDVEAVVTVSGCSVKEYTWSSDREAVATVSGSGAKARITAAATGSATVAVAITTDTGLKATASIPVYVGDAEPETPKSIVVSGSALGNSAEWKTSYGTGQNKYETILSYDLSDQEIAALAATGCAIFQTVVDIDTEDEEFSISIGAKDENGKEKIFYSAGDLNETLEEKDWYKVIAPSDFSDSDEFGFTDIRTIFFRTNNKPYTGNLTLTTVNICKSWSDGLYYKDNLQIKNTAAPKWATLSTVALPETDWSDYSTVTIEYETEDKTALYGSVYASSDSSVDLMMADAADGKVTMSINHEKLDGKDNLVAALKTKAEGFRGPIAITKITIS